MQDLPVSVVVVSRGRPDSLALCLTGLSRLHYQTYEIIVVADPIGIAAAKTLVFAEHLKLIEFDQPNISAARNLGISAAAGEIVAFLDDDAVPEPGWLFHLAAAFDDPEVAAAGGFVLGRNGISYQWKARSVGPDGTCAPLSVDETRPTVLKPPAGQAIKTEGTNMAVRFHALQKLGGFDESFRFFLDETDLNMRLARLGYATAIVPFAVVHHAYASSPRRQRNRAVLDLRDVGRSSALFWRKHGVQKDWPHYRRALVQEQRLRVIAQMRDGLLEPGDVRHALRSLASGLDEGFACQIEPPFKVSRPHGALVLFPTRAVKEPLTLSAGLFGRPALRAKAARLAAEGHTVSLFCLSPTAVFHTVLFSRDGYWLQRGGLFGKSLRNGPLFRLTSRTKRVRQEVERVFPVRETGCFLGKGKII